jgi:glyoxalase family protein
MSSGVLGIHHITAIAGNAKRNFEFYTNVLGLRLVKKTVNFDDPGTYHFYFGNEKGEPGTILTFFPWEGVPKGKTGAGQVTSVSFSITQDAVPFWLDRLDKFDVFHNNLTSRLDEEVVVFLDPDGLKLEFISHPGNDRRAGWETEEIPGEYALKGFYNATLTLEGYETTANLLTDLFGYELIKEDVNRFRFINKNIQTANILDLVCLPSGQRGRVAGGSVHHIAFRVADEGEQLLIREKLVERDFNVTPQLDRNYFKSVYFREPGGVLFEIATDPPGFTVDETPENLGAQLKLPGWLEPRRDYIEAVLPEIS